MEMTFPHSAMRQDSVTSRHDFKAMLAAAMARQANSRTVRALRQAEREAVSGGDNVANRIHYFANAVDQEMAIRGAFWRNVKPEPTSEPAVYQAALAYIKEQSLNPDSTGEKLNHAGHGALRTL
jgi:hypothetical protein